MSVLLKELKAWVDLTDGRQKRYFAKQLSDAHPVSVLPLNDVLTKAQISKVKKLAKPKVKQCYKNATLIAEVLHDIGCGYVEGKMDCHGVGIDHAWNYIERNGKFVYFDATMELALMRDPSKVEYLALHEYTLNDVQSVIFETGYYGDVYSYLFYKSLKEKENGNNY